MPKFVLVYADYLYFAGNGDWSEDLQAAKLFDNPAEALNVLGPLDGIHEYSVKAVERVTTIQPYGRGR